MSDYLQRFREYADLFYSYFPSNRDDVDLIVLRGHQLVEALTYKFLTAHVEDPDQLEQVRLRWSSTLALVRALRSHNRDSEKWVWTSSICLERARNRFAHDLDTTKGEERTQDFINAVRGNYSGYSSVPGESDLKKSIFILYFSMSSILALEEFPPCTATSLVREDIARFCAEIIAGGRGRTASPADQEGVEMRSTQRPATPAASTMGE